MQAAYFKQRGFVRGAGGDVCSVFFLLQTLGHGMHEGDSGDPEPGAAPEKVGSGKRGVGVVACHGPFEVRREQEERSQIQLSAGREHEVERSPRYLVALEKFAIALKLHEGRALRREPHEERHERP